jgi:hypothetical protein
MKNITLSADETLIAAALGGRLQAALQRGPAGRTENRWPDDRKPLRPDLRVKMLAAALRETRALI